MERILLSAGDYALEVEPARGGSIARFAWRDRPLMRPTCGPSILDVACFPLVPFSNRIANGRFEAGGRAIGLRPNFPGSDHPHPLHGLGWLARWEVVARTPSLILRHRHAPGEWPWRYEAQQEFELAEDGLRHVLRLRNMSGTAMPAGLGFHPYFPRTPRTLFTALHRGEWTASDEGLPISLDRRAAPIDWWNGAPVAQRIVDTVYTGREGAMRIAWPEEGLALEIAPVDGLPFTVVYVPDAADFFCVEPVSHATDPFNRGAADELTWLAPGETIEVAVGYRAVEAGR